MMQTDEQLVAMFQQGNLDALRELRDRMRPTVDAHVNKFLTGPGHISRAAMKAEADQLLVAAARGYKPDTGAMFKTHLYNNLRRLDRYTKTNANIAYKPEARANLLTNFNQQVTLLTEKKNRPPTTSEIADHMSIPVTEVRRIQMGQRREIPWSHGTGTSTQDMDKARVSMILDNVYPELTADERVVFEYTTGRNGKKQTSVGGEIAQKTGFSQAKVSQLRTRIAERIKPHLTNVSMGVE